MFFPAINILPRFENSASFSEVRSPKSMEGMSVVIPLKVVSVISPRSGAGDFFCALHFLNLLMDGGADPLEAVLGVLDVRLTLTADSASVKVVRDSRAVDSDGARPLSRLTSLCTLDRAALPVRLGAGDVLERSNGWIPRRADEGGGGATVIFTGGFPGIVAS